MAPPRKRTTTRTPARRKSALRSVSTNGSDNLVLKAEDHQAVLKAHNLVSMKDLELKAANHFLDKINEEIAEKYALPQKFTIDLVTGEITEG